MTHGLTQESKIDNDEFLKDIKTEIKRTYVHEIWDRKQMMKNVL